MESILELRGVSKDFGAYRAVSDVSLNIQPGEFFALLGPSGCGKTTILRMIAGFEDTTVGDIFLEGKRINPLRPYERNVSTVFQSYALFPHLTARQNVEFGLRRKHVPEPEISRKVAEAFDLVHLTGKEDRQPSQLSGGERQRVALARSLVLEPAVLLLDEPLSALDPNLRAQVRSELKALQSRIGIAFVFVTHDRDEALSMSDRIALLHQGKLQQVGTPQQLYMEPANRFAASFLGGVNWIGAIGVRPEATRLSRSRPDATKRAAQAVIEGATFLGSSIHVEARLLSGETVISEVSRLEQPFIKGEQVHVWWQAADELQNGS
jgi:spermidine/putrescine transport system ATP-binding protein